MPIETNNPQQVYPNKAESGAENIEQSQGTFSAEEVQKYLDEGVKIEYQAYRRYGPEYLFLSFIGGALSEQAIPAEHLDSYKFGDENIFLTVSLLRLQSDSKKEIQEGEIFTELESLHGTRDISEELFEWYFSELRDTFGTIPDVLGKQNERIDEMMQGIDETLKNTALEIQSTMQNVPHEDAVAELQIALGKIKSSREHLQSINIINIVDTLSEDFCSLGIQETFEALYDGKNYAERKAEYLSMENQAEKEYVCAIAKREKAELEKEIVVEVTPNDNPMSSFFQKHGFVLRSNVIKYEGIEEGTKYVTSHLTYEQERGSNMRPIDSKGQVSFYVKTYGNAQSVFDGNEISFSGFNYRNIDENGEYQMVGADEMTKGQLSIREFSKFMNNLGFEQGSLE